MVTTSARADGSDATWAAAWASERGSAHAGDAPNQDAVEVRRIVDADGAVAWLAAVSDGHGGPRYVRSHLGARRAVEIALDLLAHRASVTEHPHPEHLVRAAVPDVVEEWRAWAQEHASGHPFTDEERSRSGVADLDDDPLFAYGATLLLVVVLDRGMGIAQIGDGDVLVRTDGYVTRPVPGDPRLVAGETTSLCLGSAVADFRYATLTEVAGPDLVMLASDGYGNSFAQPDWWRSLVDDVALFVDSHGLERVRAELPGWLAESARVGGDDVSAAVLVREPWCVPPGSAPVVQLPERSAERPAAQRPPVTAVTAPGRTLDLDEGAGPPGQEVVARRRSASASPTGVVATVFGVLVAVLAVVVWAATSRGADSPDAPGVPDSSTTTTTTSSTTSPDPATSPATSPGTGGGRGDTAGRGGRGGRHGAERPGRPVGPGVSTPDEPASDPPDPIG